MIVSQTQVVWFKRDLRTFDHEALFNAVNSGPVICIYIIESDYWQLNSTSNRQWNFIRQSLIELSSELANYGLSLHIVKDDAVSILDRLLKKYGIFTLHSHLETGCLWTYKRDKAVARWCNVKSIQWKEYAQTGVFRPGKKRSIPFRQHWEIWANQPMFDLPINEVEKREDVLTYVKNLPYNIKTDEIDCPDAQIGGRSIGLEILDSFLDTRGRQYMSRMSSPMTAEHNCSRLSPYITYGCLSLREVVQTVSDVYSKSTDKEYRKNLAAFRTRLWWHCYWLQTLENNPEIEIKTLVPELQLLNRPWDSKKFEAWKTGQTGWPLVDACMRFLHQHGWINFSMRAMLVTIATCTLSLPWKPVAEWLAKMFVDFEPGIHYPQIQMHGGTAGGKVLRIYNPIIQASTLDPNGKFIRRWVPELQNFSDNWLLRPWDMPDDLRFKGGHDLANGYPKPLVDFELANKSAKQQINEICVEFKTKPSQGFRERKQRHGNSKKRQTQNNKAHISEQGKLF